MKKNSAIFTTTFISLFLFSCNFFDTKNTINSNENFGVSNDSNGTVPDWILISNKSATLPITNTKNTQQFVEGSKDIPLADNLTKVSDDDLGFDSTAGSIVSVAYKSSAKLKKVKDFYAKTLPQFGWKSAEGNLSDADLVRFERDNEKLEIEFLSEGNLVKFFIEATSR